MRRWNVSDAYVEDNDAYKLINPRHSRAKTQLQLFFGLLWCSTDFDVNREPNNGRGPVDFKVGFGSGDKSLIEFKLASNSALKRNLENQVGIYEKANKTSKSVKVIICYSAFDEKGPMVLRELKLDKEPPIVVIDAKSDNKPSASKA